MDYEANAVSDEVVEEARHVQEIIQLKRPRAERKGSWLDCRC